MNSIEILFQFRTFARPPIRLEAHHQDVRLQFADARRLHQRPRARFEILAIHKRVERLDLVLLEPIGGPAMHEVAMLLVAGTAVDVTANEQRQVLGQLVGEVDENRSSVGQIGEDEDLQ